MTYTIEKFREYARSLDERVSDVAQYSDAMIDERIIEGLSLAQDIKPIFYAEDIVDLTIPISNGILTTEIVLTKEPHSVYDNSVICDRNYFAVTITADNHVIVAVKPNAGVATSKIVTIKYFYYPTLPFVSLSMTPEIYKYVRACIASCVYSNLSDEVNETLYLNKANSFANTGTFDVEKDLMDTPSTRLWQGTYV